MGAFADQVDAAIAAYWAKAALVVIGTIEECSRRLIVRSPVGMPETWKRKPPADYVPGQFRSNWNLGVDAKDDTITAAKTITVVNHLERIPAVPFGHTYYASNAVPYAWRLEVDGWSRQAPDGMVRLVAMDFEAIVREQANSLSRTSAGALAR